MDAVYLVHGVFRPAVHRVVFIIAPGPCRVRDSDNVAVQGVRGLIAVPVGDGYDLAVLIVPKILRIRPADLFPRQPGSGHRIYRRISPRSGISD